MARPTIGDPHHDGSPLHSPAGAGVGLGDTVPVRVRVPHRPDGSPGATHVVLRSVRDGEPAVTAAQEEARDETATWWSAELTVHNPLTSYRFLVGGAAGEYRWLNAAGVHGRDVSDAGDFRVSTEHRLPDWVPDQVGYQVFPDRFARTETGAPLPAWARPADWDEPVVHQGPEVPYQLYGGTLDGVVEHLDHLERLGATLLYLTPVFESRSNHRYDASSFDRVDPLLGGDAAFARLLEAAHRRGLRVVGDLTTNHTGDDHEWFHRARAEPDSPEHGFYRFEGDVYAAWLGIESLPKLDHSSRELAERLYDGDGSITARWLREGLDGWRIDVANMTGRLGADDHAHAVARTMRRTLDAVAPDAWLLAEHGHDATGDLQGPGWHGTMDYAGFTRPAWCWLNGGGHDLHYLGLPVPVPTLPGAALVDTMRDVRSQAPWSSWLGSTLHLDSHDTPRFRTITGGGTSGWVDADGSGRGRHQVGIALQLTMPGVPVLFAGDELGLTGVDGEHARTPFPWGRRDDWDAATLASYCSWIALRRRHDALRRGGLRWLQVGDDSLTYVRELADEQVLVHLARRAGPPARIPVSALGPGVRALESLEGAPLPVVDGWVELPGDGPLASAALVGR